MTPSHNTKIGDTIKICWDGRQQMLFPAEIGISEYRVISMKENYPVINRINSEGTLVPFVVKSWIKI